MILTLDGLKYLGWIAADTDSVMLHTVPSEIYLKHLRGRYQHRRKGKSLRRHPLKPPSRYMLLDFHVDPLSAEAVREIKITREWLVKNTQPGGGVTFKSDRWIYTPPARKEYRHHVPNS